MIQYHRWRRRLAVGAANWIIRRSLTIVALLRDKVVKEDSTPPTADQPVAYTNQPPYGPPQHWIDMVSRYAPQLLQSGDANDQYNDKNRNSAQLDKSAQGLELGDSGPLDAARSQEIKPVATTTTIWSNVAKRIRGIKTAATGAAQTSAKSFRNQREDSPLVESQPTLATGWRGKQKPPGQGASEESTTGLNPVPNQRNITDLTTAPHDNSRTPPCDRPAADYGRKNAITTRSIGCQVGRNEVPPAKNLTSADKQHEAADQRGGSQTPSNKEFDTPDNTYGFSSTTTATRASQAADHYGMGKLKAEKQRRQDPIVQQHLLKQPPITEIQNNTLVKEKCPGLQALAGSEPAAVREVLAPWPLLPDEKSDHNLFDEKWPALPETDFDNPVESSNTVDSRQRQWVRRLEKEQKGAAWNG